MAADSDEEWLQELLAPAPKRPRTTSDDDTANLHFLHELLNIRKSTIIPVATTMPAFHAERLAAPLALPTMRPALPTVRPALPTVRPAVPSDRNVPVDHISNTVSVKPKKFDGPTSTLLETKVSKVSLSKPQSFAKVVFKVSPSSNSGAILDHAEKIVQGIIRQGPTIFKIGITADPSHRWENKRYGYQHDRDKYQQMVVLSEADSAGAAMLEASLIKTFKNRDGCRNAAPGGEGVRHGCLIYTYLVYRHL